MNDVRINKISGINGVIYVLKCVPNMLYPPILKFECQCVGIMFRDCTSSA